MSIEKNITLTPEKFAENLAAFAIDREDLKALLAAIPENPAINKTTIEYELQILKILSVGWAISFYMPATDKNKAPISEMFWENIRQISINISNLTQTTTGQQIDYFEILKTRLNTYLEVMQNNPNNEKNPAAVIGPCFAQASNCGEDAVAVLVGTKMFTLTLGAVKEYMNATRLEDVTLN